MVVASTVAAAAIVVPTASFSCCVINCERFRKSFHGFPPGNAVLLDSPDSFIVTPMQIDTVRRVQFGLLSCIFW